MGPIDEDLEDYSLRQAAIMESQNGLDWKGPQISSSIPLAIGRDATHYIRLPRALSNLAFNTSRDGPSTTFLWQPVYVPHHPE